MNKKNKMLLGVLCLVCMLFGVVFSASADEINLGTFRNVVAGSGGNIQLVSANIQKQGWDYNSGNWYYFNQDGKMCTGWKQINGYWYYFNQDGKMASNTVIDGYILNANGVYE